jgi:uncharacterized protein (TIGR03435 family)
MTPRTVAIPVPLLTAADIVTGGDPDDIAQPDRTLKADVLTTARWNASSLITLLRTLWGIGMLACLFRVLAGVYEVHQLRRHSIAWNNAPESPSRGVALFLSEELTSPMTCGAIPPAIGFPVDAPGWSPADVHRALTHELEHIRRFDWLVMILAHVTCAIYWFHPLAWIAARRLRLEAERACDDAVVREAGPADYAQQLVTMARRASASHPSTALLAMADRGSLATRVQAVLDSTHARGRASRAVTVTTIATAVALAGSLGPVRLSAKSTPVDVLAIPASLAGPTFETVSIHVARTEDGPTQIDFDPTTGHFVAIRQTLRSLIAYAYAPTPSWPASMLELPDARLLGGPVWMKTDQFTIHATTRRAMTPGELQLMLRRLLVGYFNLAVHIETTSTPAYRLVRTASGAALGPQLRPIQSPCNGPDIDEGGLGHVELHCTTMSAMAASVHLSEVLGRPLVDRTSLTAAYDVSLRFRPTRDELSMIYEIDPDTELPSEFKSRPTIFAAFEQQLGLRLEPTHASFQRLTVDSADRPVPGP